MEKLISSRSFSTVDASAESLEVITDTIIEMCNKTFDFYKKLTYNTVLEDCVVDIGKMAIKTQQKNKAKYEGTWKNR